MTQYCQDALTEIIVSGWSHIVLSSIAVATVTAAAWVLIGCSREAEYDGYRTAGIVCTMAGWTLVTSLLLLWATHGITLVVSPVSSMSYYSMVECGYVTPPEDAK